MVDMSLRTIEKLFYSQIQTKTRSACNSFDAQFSGDVFSVLNLKRC